MKMNILLGLVGVITAIAVCVVLNLTASVLIPLIIAWFLAQIAKPIMAIGERLRLPHLLNVGLVFVAIIFVCFLAFKFVSGQIAESERIFTDYGPKLNDLFNDVLALLQVPESFSIVALLRRYLAAISGGIITFSSQFFLTLIFLAFLLLEFPIWNRKINMAFPAGGDRVRSVMSSISKQTSQYLAAMVLISVLTGCLVWGFLSIMGVELAAGWGILAFILNFVPTIGSIIATIPPVLMAMLQFGPTSAEAIVTLAVLGTVQMATGNILAPWLFGDRLGLSPVVVMLSLLLWTLILGIPGAILSVPIASIIKIVCENIPSLRPIAVFMGTGSEPAAAKALASVSRRTRKK